MNDNTLAAQHQARAQAILDQMTLDEKLAQIVGFWDKGDGEAVAPLQGVPGSHHVYRCYTPWTWAHYPCVWNTPRGPH